MGRRHEDWAAGKRTVEVVARVNDNGARGKAGRARTVPVCAALVRLYVDYLRGEYGELNSDHVFVNPWAVRIAIPLSYAAVFDLVCRLRRAPGWSSTRTGSATPTPPGEPRRRFRDRQPPVRHAGGSPHRGHRAQPRAGT